MSNVKVSLNKSFKNYMKLNCYCDLTREMIMGYNQMKKEFNNVTKEYIQKIIQVSANFTKNISHYKSILQFSKGELQDLIQLFERIKSLILLQAEKLQSFINGCEAEESKNKINQEQFNNFEKITNEFLLKEKKITKSYTDLENYYKNLYTSYNLIENSLAINIISNENKISIVDFLNQESKNIFDKEQLIIQAKDDILGPKNDFFLTYDEFIKKAKEICLENINILRTNINCFVSLYANYCKTCADDLENLVKGIAKNEIKTNFSKVIDSMVSSGFVRDININKYKIKIISNRYIEDKNKKLNLEKLDKKGYIIENDKIYLKDENIYEIVKIMYGQFQFIDEKCYNLTEEQIKINVKNLTNKLLYFGNKKIKIFELGVLDPINPDELKLLFKYLEKSFNRLQFLKVLNLFRAKGIYEIPEKEYDILIKIFLLIADKILTDNDYSCIHLLLILSQTFYCKKNDKTVYIESHLKNNKIFFDVELWNKYMNNTIEEDLNRIEKTRRKDSKSKEEIPKNKINNILSSQLIPFCDNMYDFGMPVENIYKIIRLIMDKYKVEDSLKNTIEDLINSKKKKSE